MIAVALVVRKLNERVVAHAEEMSPAVSVSFEMTAYREWCSAVNFPWIGSACFWFNRDRTSEEYETSLQNFKVGHQARETAEED